MGGASNTARDLSLELTILRSEDDLILNHAEESHYEGRIQVPKLTANKLRLGDSNSIQELIQSHPNYSKLEGAQIKNYGTEKTPVYFVNLYSVGPRRTDLQRMNDLENRPENSQFMDNY